MEPKKNPIYDAHRYRSVLFTVGLMTSIAIVIMAFEWKAALKAPPQCRPDSSPPELVYHVLPTDHTHEKPSAVKPKRTTVEFVEVKVVPLEVPTDVISEMPVDNVINVQPAEMPDEEIVDPFVIGPEVMPEPEHGYQGFYELLRKSLRYPKKAQALDIEGKVFVEFIVDSNGRLSDLKVLKGIGAGCDEEAIRVLQLSKWNPGKQRGKPVRVKMVMPIHFKLR